MRQWTLKIREYADRMLEDLDTLAWPEHIKEAQRNWIGRSEGAEIDFTLSTDDQVTVFTTRPDTLFGATYMVLAPEHELVAANKDWILRAKSGWSGQIGWWVGWVETSNGAVFFALNIDTPNRQKDLSKRERIAREILASLNALPLSKNREVQK